MLFRSVEQFDFSEMLDKTIKNYSPNDMTAEKKEELIQKLCDLPEKQHFAQQFKRSCLPDGPKVGSVALSPRGDLRMPSDASARIWQDVLEKIEI